MPNIEPAAPWGDERVIFENWADDGCHVFNDHKYVLTLATPESSKCDEAYRANIEDWTSPDEYCANLTAVLRGLGASPAVLAAVENEREHYQRYPIEPPTRMKDDLLREVRAACQ